ncbi:MAG: PQQ-like beta-propeller repeat protein [Gammaproteobacteria bacterium]|nr:PQQ-like beta-propeller repeat protein [Gammaproteobacteria bacterium]
MTCCMLLLTAPTAHAQGQLSRERTTPVEKNGPYDRVYYPQNAPAPGEGAAFPQQWLYAYGNNERNAAAFSMPRQEPDWVREGVAWQFAEARAWVLTNKPFASEALGEAGSDTTMTQWMGNTLGVAAVDGVIYAQSSDQFIYALNARTGKLIWRTSPVPTTFMGQPLVHGDIVYVNAGTVGFNFSNIQAYAKTGQAIRGAGVEFNGVYALNRHTGELLWHFDTKGDVMPTPALSDGRLIFSTGAGEVFALDEKSGEPLWINKVGGMGNMSSPAVYQDKIYVGMSVPAFLFCLDAKTGKTLWKEKIPQAINTGMGDVSPAVADGVVVTDAVSAPQTVAGKVSVDVSVRAFDSDSGRPLWTHNMGRGPKPPAFKGGVPMIHDGTVYIGAPVKSLYQALDLKTGKLLWTWAVPQPGPAGTARAPASFYDGMLYIAGVDSVYAVDPKTGMLAGKKYIGGRFGLVSPTIVGGTIYLGNSWDWIIALPVADVNPNYHPDSSAHG